MKRQITMPPAVVAVARRKNRRARGLGFVVSGGYVVTAAHNLPPPESANGIYDSDLLVIEVKDGDELRMTPVFVDQCTDIAVLAISDEYPEVTDALDEVAPLLVSWNPEVGKHSGMVATHDRGLVKAACEIRASANRVCFTGKTAFAGGTSGGPVLDSKGRVMAVVSQTTSAEDHRLGWGPAISECLPAWLVKKIVRYERAADITPTKPKRVTRKRTVRKPRAGG
jgi:S1-C subfamily serine protease